MVLHVTDAGYEGKEGQGIQSGCGLAKEGFLKRVTQAESSPASDTGDSCQAGRPGKGEHVQEPPIVAQLQTLVIPGRGV